MNNQNNQNNPNNQDKQNNQNNQNNPITQITQITKITKITQITNPNNQNNQNNQNNPNNQDKQNKLNKLLKKYSEQILYLIFGVLTTIVNIIVFGIISEYLNGTPQISYWIAWIISVIFAYLTNKKWVFKSSEYKINVVIQEAIKFAAARLITGIIGSLIIAFGTKILHQNPFMWNIIQNIFVIISNYGLSKWLIFSKKKG